MIPFHLPQNPSPLRYAVGLIVFAAGVYIAVIICIFGFISLFTELDVIAESDAGTAVGSVMVAAAVGALAGGLATIVYRVGGQLQRVPVLKTFMIGLSAFLVTGALSTAWETVPFRALFLSHTLL